jgi:hypothetical protein
MGEINRAAGLTEKQKNWNGWKYVIVLVVVFFGALGIQQCTDSSAYTFNGEKYNIIGLSIFGGLVLLAFAYWFFFIKRRK